LRITVPTPTTDLLETGLLDSMGLVELVAAIEQRFDVVINLMDLDLDHVRTVHAIYTLVDGVLAPSGSLVSTTLDGAA
jgi:D-alanine--poly(phosphoribitol) ligase subunit 2